MPRVVCCLRTRPQTLQGVKGVRRRQVAAGRACEAHAPRLQAISRVGPDITLASVLGYRNIVSLDHCESRSVP